MLQRDPLILSPSLGKYDGDSLKEVGAPILLSTALERHTGARY